MKTITKIILCSCVFCYFAGIWIIASRFGLIKLVSRYGLAEAFDQIPKDFPQIKYLYIGLAVYTVFFVIVAYITVKVSRRAAEEQEKLQQESGAIVTYAEQMNMLLSRFERSAINDADVKQKLQKLSRRIASLPPAVVRDVGMRAEVTGVVGVLQELLSDKCTAEVFSAAIDNAQDNIESLKRRSVTVKY